MLGIKQHAETRCPFFRVMFPLNFPFHFPQNHARCDVIRRRLTASRVPLVFQHKGFTRGAAT